MNIAIIAPYLTSIGGAEKVTGLHYDYLKRKNDVTVFTSVYDRKVYPELFSDAKIIELLPWMKGRPLMRTIINLFFCFISCKRLKDFDLIIAEAPNAHILAARAKKAYKTPVIWVSHHPNKVAYSVERKGIIVTLLSKLSIPADKKAVKLINVILANSEFMEKKFLKIYGPEISNKLSVLYEPTQIKKFRKGRSKGYFLCVGRLEKVKRIEMLVKVFNEIDKQLIIIGSGPLKEKLMKLKKSNTKILSRVSEKELIDYYSRCEAVIQLNKDEDFGLVPVEAMASGKPVIAVSEGGFKETITKNTGILLRKPYEKNLLKTLNSWSNKFKSSDCIVQAGKFSKKTHLEKLEKIIKQVIS